MPEPTPPPVPCSCDVALQNPLGQACNEEAFRYFLDVEQKRSLRSGRTFLLLLVRLKGGRRTESLGSSVIAEKLFASLWLCLRETDQVGWFREGRVAGALLTDVSDANVAGPLCQKVLGSLRQRLPLDIASRVEVRALQLPSPRKGRN